jgi:hypothetical protein
LFAKGPNYPGKDFGPSDLYGSPQPAQQNPFAQYGQYADRLSQEFNNQKSNYYKNEANDQYYSDPTGFMKNQADQFLNQYKINDYYANNNPDQNPLTGGGDYWNRGFDWDSGLDTGKGGEIMSGGQLYIPQGDGTFLNVNSGKIMTQEMPQQDPNLPWGISIGGTPRPIFKEYTAPAPVQQPPELIPDGLQRWHDEFNNRIINQPQPDRPQGGGTYPLPPPQNNLADVLSQYQPPAPPPNLVQQIQQPTTPTAQPYNPGITPGLPSNGAPYGGVSSPAPVPMAPQKTAPAPVTRPALRPAPAPVARPAPAPVARPAPAPVARPAPRPVQQPVARPAPKPVQQPVLRQPTPTARSSNMVTAPARQAVPQPMARSVSRVNPPLLPTRPTGRR